ncbi:AlbA family DNA-binding domain-containing protein [Aerococcus urinaeequi]
MEIDKLLAMNEGKNIEFKKAKNQLPKAFWETYSAFANTDGGIIVLGFDENDKANVGIKAPYKMKDDLFNTLNNKQKVSTNVISEDDVIIYTLSNGLAILVIKVKEASYHQKPVYLNNNPQQAYERFGEGDRKLSIEKYKALVVGSHEITDNELLKGFDLTDLNENDLELYRESLLEQTNNTKYSTITHRDMLIEIGALKKDRQGDGEYHLTTGGLLFFGKFN